MHQKISVGSPPHYRIWFLKWSIGTEMFHRTHNLRVEIDSMKMWEPFTEENKTKWNQNILEMFANCCKPLTAFTQVMCSPIKLFLSRDKMTIASWSCSIQNQLIHHYFCLLFEFPLEGESICATEPKCFLLNIYRKITLN